ncbi:DNA-binding response OmpR family regulator [Scopulibacillus darangshiensis]|uniref:DNA-binding response OmpR family regulator n=1 Tax=Scopulibacillus darangshiensis TaxID=442528 RepID=A0A4R2P8F5_9BACL|nr:response regulator transcription factor [Scopulibacillus darangshiensis]TCP30588.1 DNA-binding response OmpR family regulator [Scopulibacillus darangshiensis]
MFKIFLVEDDDTMRDIIFDNIKKWGFEGYLPHSFHDVFKSFIDCQPHLVLMDINLPEFDGFYLCQKIREVSKVPIIFLSSRDTPMDMIMAMNMGGDDFIQKPIDTDVLMAKINAMLRRTYSYTDTVASVIEWGGAILNLKDSTLLYNNGHIELTKNEFKIMYLLMKNAGKVVTRDNIMRSLWEDESFVDENTLTVNVVRIRKKLTEAGLKDFIQTKKGQGYIIL